MNNCLMSLVAQATGDDLCLEIKLDNLVKFSKILTTKPENIKFEFNNKYNVVHVIEIVLSGKQPNHTVIDNSGTILSDRVVNISDVCFDNIQLQQIFLDKTIYIHDFNGTADEIKSQFFGAMGCNGTLRFEFMSPVYPWLLENM